MLNKFFAPYAEYALRTKLSEAELRTSLQRECGRSSVNWKRGFSAAWAKRDGIPFLLRKNGTEIVLAPSCPGRNSARGELHLTLEQDRHSADTALHIVICPRDFRPFCVLWLGFLSVWVIVVLCCRKWMMLIPVPVMLGGFLLPLHLCRSLGKQEIPRIRHSFEALIRKLEKEGKT